MSNGCLPQSQWQITSDPNCPGMGGDTFLQAFMSENPGQEHAPKDPVSAFEAFNTEALLGFTPPPNLGTFIGLVGPPPVVAPAVAAAVAAPAAVLGGIGALGIAASLATGAPPPVESLTGSGLEPQPEPEAAGVVPPAGPPPVATAFADELAPNWWELMQIPWYTMTTADQIPDFRDIYEEATSQYPLRSVGTGFFKELFNLLNPGNVSDPGSLFGPPAQLSPGPGGLSPTATTGDPLPTITVEAPGPARAPPLVADPILTPIGFPEPGPIAEPISPARTQPSPATRPLTPTLPSTSPGWQVAPAPGPSPGLAPARAPAPSVSPQTPALPSPAPVQSPISTQTPVLPYLSPVITGPSIAVGGPGPAIPGFATGLMIPGLDLATDPQAQAAAARKQCTTTQTKDRPPKKKKKRDRTLCHVGSYRELKSGLIKHPTRTIPCR